uniref:DNA (cytosine-5-)-methyltransferase n=1 Tax=Aegilops tauschii TaxID=37682 RepID=M8AQG8_AEGTA
MADWTSDSDGSDKFEWDSDGEAEASSAPAMRNFDAPGPSTLSSNGWINGEAPPTSLIEGYVEMGFPKEMVMRSIKEIGHGDADALLELLLTYKALGDDDDALGNHSTSGCNLPIVEDDDDLSARKRGYIHNLPTENRSPLLPLPPKTIFEAFPHYKKWWPSWDQRTHFNCLQTCTASAPVTERIQQKLSSSGNPPPQSVQKYVRHQCSKWNLVWVGKDKAAPLEPHEMEYLLGFPKDHTRGFGKTQRYKSLGNSFQVDTVAYHLSVLRDMFPNGITVTQQKLSSSGNPPPQSVQKYVRHQCSKWNLVWVGKDKAAPLEPHEMEYLLGFPKDHTRGFGKTQRYKSLGNSFQVDTVAYHLSVLRDMFPNGITVLSLFTGIGGGEVALHKLGIHMRAVVSIEICKANRKILRSWWDQTQTGTLIEIDDVKSLKDDEIASYVHRFGGFDLVIGGSPCCCLDHMDNMQSHDAVIRFPSIDDFKLFKECAAYKDMWASKFFLAAERYLEFHYSTGLCFCRHIADMTLNLHCS